MEKDVCEVVLAGDVTDDVTDNATVDNNNIAMRNVELYCP